MEMLCKKLDTFLGRWKPVSLYGIQVFRVLRKTEWYVNRWLPHKLQESRCEIKEPQDTFAWASTCLGGIKVCWSHCRESEVGQIGATYNKNKLMNSNEMFYCYCSDTLVFLVGKIVTVVAWGDINKNLTHLTDKNLYPLGALLAGDVEYTD